MSNAIRQEVMHHVSFGTHKRFDGSLFCRTCEETAPCLVERLMHELVATRERLAAAEEVCQSILDYHVMLDATFVDASAWKVPNILRAIEQWQQTLPDISSFAGTMPWLADPVADTDEGAGDDTEHDDDWYRREVAGFGPDEVIE
jgi:hypothetical protein